MRECNVVNCHNSSWYSVVDPEDEKRYPICQNCHTIWVGSGTPIKKFCEQPKVTEQITSALSEVFQQPAKTLKLTPKKDIPLQDLVIHARNEVLTNPAVNRIEFKYGQTYIVVAKLKETE